MTHLIFRMISLLLLLSGSTVTAQQLLVNGDFEEENICAEYKVNCAPEAWLYTVPSFIYYFKNVAAAYSGSHYLALIGGHSTKAYTRTYVRSRLVCGLQKGHRYRLRVAVKSVHPILDSSGIYFSPSDFLFLRTIPATLPATHYFVDAGMPPRKGDTAWQVVQLDFTATGQEAYLTFGYFGKRDLKGPTGIDREANFFLLLDAVSLVPLDPAEILCADWKAQQEAIYDQDERHEYQERLMKLYRGRPPAVPLPPTTRTLHIDTLQVPDVVFASNSFVLNTAARALLDSFARHIRGRSIDSVVVNGHTDSRGTDAANQELSFRRAGSVAAYLQQQVALTVISRGAGSTQPIATNRTPEGRQRNRRVEILVYKQE